MALFPSALLSLLLFLFCLPVPGYGLDAGEIVVLANKMVPEGVQLARYYMRKRHIPEENLLLLQTTTEEGIRRTFYNDEIAAPVRRFLETKPAAACLLLFYGLPLRINGSLLPAPAGTDPADYTSQRQRDPVASVDSELSLVKIADHPVPDWLPNPYFIQFQSQKISYRKGEVLMVARLDGPDPEIVRRIIDESLSVEKTGLEGKAYFDARWSRPKPGKQLSGYALYDEAIHRAAELSQKVLPTVINDDDTLLQKGEAPQAALYCGWYSLARYVDAFSWQPGAVAYHIASAECTTLKKPGSQVWCKRMLEEGVAATVGPVEEPYVQAFPFPQLFFGLLLDGDFTLAEAYFLSLPFISWKMILIGDPLYQPFRSRGIL